MPPDERARAGSIGPPLATSFAKLAGARKRRYADGLLSRALFADVGAFENEVYDGIPEALDALARDGRATFVATSKNARRRAAHPRTFRPRATDFEAIHGARDDGGLADKTELIRHVARDRTASIRRATRIAMVGDRKFDMIGARNIGIAALGALWGYGGEAELREAGADVLVATPQDIPAVENGLGVTRPDSSRLTDIEDAAGGGAPKSRPPRPRRTTPCASP